MAAAGLTNIAIGGLNIGACGNAIVLPPMLVVSGVLWVLPLLLLAVINCVPRHESDLLGMYGCLEKLFLLAVAFLVASTIYVLVTAAQTKTLESLCTHVWVPPYALSMVLLHWLSFALFFKFFCTHHLQPPESLSPGPIEFKHLKNLPPLVFPWNRHRVIRTF